METLLYIIIALLTLVVITLVISAHNNDQYHATAISATDFVRLYHNLGNAQVFHKKLFFISFLVIPHNGILIATRKKNLPIDFIEKINLYTCIRPGRNS